MGDVLAKIKSKLKELMQQEEVPIQFADSGPTVIMVAGGEFRRSLLAPIARSQLIAGVASAFAVVIAAAMLYLPTLGVFSLVPVLGVGFLLRLHGQLGKEHHDLRRIHGFTKAISGRNSLDIGLRELSSILRFRVAAVIVQGETGEFNARVYIDDRYTDEKLRTSAVPAESTDKLTIIEPGSSGLLGGFVQQLGGTRGLGLSIAEAPNVATAAAISNALAQLIGTPVRRLPMTAERVWSTMEKGRG